MLKLLAVLNVTPDSFSDGGEYFSKEKAIERALEMVEEGADIIDIGGESSRPFSDPISQEEELSRVIPVIEELSALTAIPLSIDTTKPAVAKSALAAGATYINDISGFRDEEMIEVALEFKAPIFCMHMLGRPKAMQENPHYEEGVMNHLLRWVEERAETLRERGIEREKIVFDPGIGFGKTVAHNLEILHNLDRLRAIGYPILVGASKKSFMTKILGKPPKELLPATIAVHTAALLAGADYIRAHDIGAHFDMIELIRRLKDNCS